MSLTIVIPTIDRESLLHAMWSVQAQTIPTKCLFLNDSKRRGPSATRNKLIKQVTTSWVGFCDDDDWLDEHYHEWLKEQKHADMVIFQMKRWDGIILPDHTDVDKLAYNWVGVSFALNTKIAQRFPFRGKVGEDFDLIQRVKQAGYRVIVSPRVAYFVGR